MSTLIGLDFDGTILDSRRRHVVALRLAAEQLAEPLSEGVAEAYLHLKCSGASGVDALRKLGVSAAESLAQRWTKLIESDEMLSLDRLYPNVLKSLERHRALGYAFVLVTGRQRAEAARRQVAHFGLSRHLCETIVVDPLSRSETKAMVTQDHGLEGVVGDTEVDLQWALDLNIAFHATSFGFRDEAFWSNRGVKCYGDITSLFDSVRAATARP